MAYNATRSVCDNYRNATADSTVQYVSIGSYRKKMFDPKEAKNGCSLDNICAIERRQLRFLVAVRSFF